MCRFRLRQRRRRPYDCINYSLVDYASATTDLMTNRKINCRLTAKAHDALRGGMRIALGKWVVASPVDAGKVTAP